MFFVNGKGERWLHAYHVFHATLRSEHVHEYTGETLDPELVACSIREELNYLNAKVWKVEVKTEAMQNAQAIIVRSRWVLCN